MKTQLIALATLLASSPASAALDTSTTDDLAVAPIPAAYSEAPSLRQEPGCGEPRSMIIMLRDEDGSVVAMGVAQVEPMC